MGAPVIDVVEVYWNARPCLARLGIKPERVALDPRGEHLFNEVRQAVMGAFPGVPTLVRIAVRKGAPDPDLRILRGGTEVHDGLDSLRVLIEEAAERGVPRAA
jgi:hypothetical protein